MSEPREVVDDEGIRCPYCGDLRTDDMQEYVTTWGEGEPIPTLCEVCDTEFLVKEVVERRWESTDIQGEERGNDVNSV